jgi:carbamoyl-phosphate synthase small subunit
MTGNATAGAGARAGAPAGRPPALLVLEDGTTFRGTGYGADGETFGEAVFNTGMTGYQETLTDPSYCRQIVAMTAPHIGNTGINDEDNESRAIWVSGFVIRDASPIASNLHLRERGVMRAAISTTTTDPVELLRRVQASPSMIGADLASVVSTPEPYIVSPPEGTPVRYRVAAVDLGIKTATPAAMASLGCEVHVLPAGSAAEQILGVDPDGVFFSNGPGDPAACGYAVAAMREVLAASVPLFGICLGSQVLGRALGLDTYKLRFGHRGVNQPVQDQRTAKVHITSHNHGFAVAMPPAGPGHAFETDFGPAEVTHVNLNDGVVEGLALLGRPAFAVQYHPEAAPGPHDARGLFREFCALMDSRRGAAA